MAKYNIPTQQEFQQLTEDPRTAQLEKIPQGIASALTLADAIKQRQEEQKNKAIKLQAEIQAIKDKAALAKAQVPITGQTPVSSAVPQATFNTIQGGPQQAAQDEVARMTSLPALAAKVEPEQAAKNILTPDKFATAETANGVIAYNKNNPNETVSLGQTKPSITAETKANEHQDKLEKDYRDMLNKQLSARSGGLGLQDSKVNQAIDLKQLLKQSYDSATKTYIIPPSMHTELALGLAKLLSPTGQVAVQLEQELRQKTAREGLAGAAIYLGFDPAKIGGTTQSVSNFFAHAIDRQGQVAQQLRDKYVKDLRKRAPSSLSPSRRKYLEETELGSNYNDVSNDNGPRQSPGGHSYTVE